MSLKYSIDQAASIVGSQNKLAEQLGIKGPNLSEMRNGKRACPIGMRVQIAVIAGHDTTRAIFEGLAEKLDAADAYEGQALAMIRAMVDAFPADGETLSANEKTPVDTTINGGSSNWRNRREQGI